MFNPLTRRHCLKLGLLGLGGIPLGTLLQARAPGAAPASVRAKSCILLWLDGGPSHLETFDPKPAAPLEEFMARRAIVADAQDQIERLIAEQPDWRTIADTRERNREWGRQQELLASRKALLRGVEYFGGVPAVPNAAKRILGVVVEPDGREVPNWYGALPEIDSRIAALTDRRARAQLSLDGWVKVAEQLLGEPVVTG